MSFYRAMALALASNGLRWASGTLTPANEDVDVASGLKAVLFCGVSLAAPPTLLHTFSTAVPGSNDANVRIRSYRPTSDSSSIPIASTTEVAVVWWAVGK